MLWAAIAAGVLVSAILWGVTRRTRGIRPGAEVEAELHLRLPSKWAAELTARVLDGEHISSRVGRHAGRWECRVRKAMRFHPDELDRLCGRVNQIAAGRGGGCAVHVVRAGKQVERFEH